jgi:ubiquitin-conjugating enzyme E2 J1
MSKSASLRRIQADVRELALDPSDRYHAAPLVEWHFTICGADETDFAGGVYHGRILLPPDYPFKPPHSPEWVLLSSGKSERLLFDPLVAKREQ